MVCRISRLLVFLAISCSAVLADEWYEHVSLVVNDPFQFDSQKMVLFHTGLTIGGHVAAGKIYAILPAATIAKAEHSPNHVLVVDSHTLNVAEAETYKDIFRAKSESGQIPWIVGVIGSIPVKITTVVGIATTLLDGLFRLEPQHGVSASALSELMAENGRFDLAFIVMKDPTTPTHKYISSAILSKSVPKHVAMRLVPSRFRLRLYSSS
jgi:hypothetical protein